MKRLRLVMQIAVSVSLVTGCATVASGGKQPIIVESEPAGADCILSRSGAELGRVTTPGRLSISNGTSSVRVTCTKDGFHESQVFLRARPDPRSAAGNFMLGGAVGNFVDQQSGANYRYEPSVMLWLAPNASEDTPPRPDKKIVGGTVK